MELRHFSDFEARFAIFCTLERHYSAHGELEETKTISLGFILR